MPTVPKLPQVQPNPISTPYASGTGAGLGAFGGYTAQGLSNLGQGFGQSGDVLFQLQMRQDGIARSNDDAAFTEQTTQLFRNLEEVDNFSGEAVAATRKDAQDLYAQILENHKGSPGSREELRRRLNERMASFDDNLNMQNIKYEDNKLNLDAQADLNNVNTQVMQDPNVIDSALSPMEVLQHHFKAIEDQYAFRGFSPSQIDARLPGAYEEIAASIFTPLIANGQFERAREFLQDDSLKEIISPANRRTIGDRIVRGEQAAVEAASGQTKLHFVEGKDGSIRGVNPYTGEQMSYIPGDGTGQDPLTFENEQAFRKEHNAQSDVFDIIRSNYHSMRETAPLSGEADLSTILAFYKMNDPTSIVKSNEQIMAEAMAGDAGARVQGWFKSFLEGGSLSVMQKNDILQAAHALFKAKLKDQVSLTDQYTSILRDKGLASGVLIDHVMGADGWDVLQLDEKGGPKETPIEGAGRIAKETVDFLTGTPKDRTKTSETSKTPTTFGAMVDELTKAVEDTLLPVSELMPPLEDIAAMPDEKFISDIIDAFEIEDFQALAVENPELFKFIQDRAATLKKGKSK